MSQWFRVFGRNEVQVAPSAVLDALRRLGIETAGSFRGDDLGWFLADFVVNPEEPPLRLEHYLTKEDEIRADLNSWAAWLEGTGDSPQHVRLMQHVISTAQLFTLHQPIEDADEIESDPAIEQVCVNLCQFLARTTNGVYQVDHRGFFAADGTLLVPEE